MSSWSRGRRVSYLSIGFLLLALIAGLFYVASKDEPSCSDSKQNQDETGVDCGGACTAVCTEEARALSIIWVRAVRVRDGSYGAIALLENSNIFGVKDINYRFRLYDKDNILIKEAAGKTFANPDERFIIFDTNINTGNRIPARAFITIESQSAWERFPVESVKPLMGVSNKRLLLAPAPRVEATVKNESAETLRNIRVVAVIFDSRDNAIAASETLVDSLSQGGEESVFFTWPDALSGSPSYVEIYPSVDRFSLI